MERYKGSNSHIHLIARGLMIRGEEIVLCQLKGADWFFLPGGHVEDGESARAALYRELSEEMGSSNWKITSLVGICENVFSLENSDLQHEVNIIFKVEIPTDVEIITKESHIDFVSVNKESLGDYKILPDALKKGVLKWLDNEEVFLADF